MYKIINNKNGNFANCNSQNGNFDISSFHWSEVPFSFLTKDEANNTVNKLNKFEYIEKNNLTITNE